jgi:hypothetical protein
VLSDTQANNTWCADADFSIADAMIGAIHGNDSSLGSPGWHWRLAGRFESHGAPVRLTIAARNPGLEKAWFNLGYVAIVRAGDHPEKRAMRMNLDANAPQSVSLGVAPLERGRWIVLFHATDSGAREVRSLLVTLYPGPGN